MSILIRGMEMPKTCDVCKFGYWSHLHQTGSCYLLDSEQCFDDYSTDYRTKRSEHCPLIEVPEPHGRLIDKDAIQKKCERGEYPNMYIDPNEIVAEFYAAPTIIPASDDASHQQVTAKWYKPTGMMPPEFIGRHRCSACDGFAMHDWKHHREQLTPFCPHCGAKMENGDSEL